MTSPSGGPSATDYSSTLFLPRTSFPMRPKAGTEDGLLARWRGTGLEARLRASGAGGTPYVLHDGPPYANGRLHMGHALNKVLKDVVVRSRRMEGLDVSYRPGWDCHGLPVEWKVEEAFRAAGRPKDSVPVAEFRQACRDYAAGWMAEQAREFEGLGVSADFLARYSTMDFASEAAVAAEFMRLAADGQLYRGSKPVLWSVAERTALAEAEVLHLEHRSDAAHVAFPVRSGAPDLHGAAVVAWTTTPWTLPGNRALAYSARAAHSLYEVADAPDGNGVAAGTRLLLSDALAAATMSAARVAAFVRVRPVPHDELEALTCSHPLAHLGYAFDVPFLEAGHVTDDAGTGFVHTAPGHGREDFDLWRSSAPRLEAMRLETRVPETVDADGVLTREAPGFEGRRVFAADGSQGDANEAVLGALLAAGRLVARSRLRHQYPHSWRSRKPLLYRATAQWFVPMDRPLGGPADTLRTRALGEVDATAFVPSAGRNRLRAMVEARPDWLVSRQRSWGVPLTLFVHRESGAVAPGPAFGGNAELARRVVEAFEAEGADAWFADDARDRFLACLVADPGEWDMVADVLDVWFDSGSTHAFVLGGGVADLYLEGSDQHRGWFQSSLLEACATRGRAPFRAVATHGFVLDGKGQKMSKSVGNDVTPSELVERHGVDAVRLWVVSSDWTGDLRLSPESLKAAVEAQRKVRNTLRWLLGNLAHHDGFACAPTEMPELERLLLHRMAEVDREVRAGYEALDFRRAWSTLLQFVTADLSGFHFDVRKDVLYCDPRSSHRRRAALHALDLCFSMLCRWLAPMLPLTSEEAWLERHPSEEGSVHLERFAEVPGDWRDDPLAAKWDAVKGVRRVALAELELERAAGRVRGALDAAVAVTVSDPRTVAYLAGVDLAEVFLTSSASVALTAGSGPENRSECVVTATVSPAVGTRCARSWRVLREVGTCPGYPTLSPRDALAVAEVRSTDQGTPVLPERT